MEGINLMENKHFGYRVFIVTDDPVLRMTCHHALAREGYMVDTGPSGKRTSVRMGMNIDIVVNDLGTRDDKGAASLKTLKKLRPNADVVLLTDAPTIESAVKLMKRGAMHYMAKLRMRNWQHSSCMFSRERARQQWKRTV